MGIGNLAGFATGGSVALKGRTMGIVTAPGSGVIGLKALDDMLTRLPKKLQQKIMRKAMQQALKPFYQEARRNVPVQWQRYEIWNEDGGFMSDVFNQITRRRTGRLKKSLLRRTKSNQYRHTFSGNLYVQHKKWRAYYSHLTEWGTDAHFIQNYFGQRGHKKWVKGQKGQLWMTKSWNKRWRTSLSKFKKVMKRETEKQFLIYVLQLKAEEKTAMVSSTNVSLSL